MKITTVLISVFTLITLSGCNNERPHAVYNPASDTVVSNYASSFRDVELGYKYTDTIVMIDNEPYTLQWTTNQDTLQRLHYNDEYMYKGVYHKDKYSGYNTTYTVSLYDQSNKKIFSNSFTKERFKEILFKGTLTQSGPFLPHFLGYYPKFDAFAFTINFWVPESDVGEQAFMMIDRKGIITECFMNNYFGGGDCDGEVTLSSDGSFILTCYQILHADGAVVSIDGGELQQIGTRLINDNCILVIHEHNDTINRENAILMDNHGETLMKFTYTGYYNVLGNVVPTAFDSITGNYFLLDDAGLRIINKKEPMNTYLADFESMQQPYDLIAGENEVMIRFKTEVAQEYFFMDTLTLAIKHKQMPY